jgi:dTDP-4-amino-4,6-dideoxy-D-galactose acyltransferase
MAPDNLCQYLEWDSEFFGYRIARVTVNWLDRETIEQVMRWCKSNNIDCLYFLANAGDGKTIRLVEDHRFRFVDIRVTLERGLDAPLDIPNKTVQGEIRLCRPDDIPALRAIARVNYHNTRFYDDPNFPESLCDTLYETWIEKSCKGYADEVLVAELEGDPVGYITCHLLEQSVGQIGLVGVHPESRSKGMGEKLINESLCWFTGQGLRRVRVVTQGRNCKAQRLYQKNGFLTDSVQLWYHRWFPPKGAIT